MFNDNTIVYWAPLQFSFIAEEPDTAIIDLSQRINSMDNTFRPMLGSDIKSCPAVTSNLKNTFRIKSPIKYNIKWNSDKILESQYNDQKFFDQNVILRDQETGFVTLNIAHIIFFTEEDSLVMEQRHPSFSISDMAKNISVVEGAFDIGKWFRPLDFAFFINHPHKYIEIERGDPLFYVKFNTSKKIILKKFVFDDQLRNIHLEISNSRGFLKTAKSTSVFSKLEKYYQTFQHSRYKKRILKLIKQNVY